jgi:hypothetical protein
LNLDLKYVKKWLCAKERQVYQSGEDGCTRQVYQGPGAGGHLAKNEIKEGNRHWSMSRGNEYVKGSMSEVSGRCL